MGSGFEGRGGAALTAYLPGLRFHLLDRRAIRLALHNVLELTTALREGEIPAIARRGGFSVAAPAQLVERGLEVEHGVAALASAFARRVGGEPRPLRGVLAGTQPGVGRTRLRDEPVDTLVQLFRLGLPRRRALAQPREHGAAHVVDRGAGRLRARLNIVAVRLAVREPLSKSARFG